MRDLYEQVNGLRSSNSMDDTVLLFVKMSLTTFGTWIATMLGGWDMLTQALIIFMCADIVTGFFKALYGKSEKGKFRFSEISKGIIRKVMSLFVVAVAVVLNNIIAPESDSIRFVVIAWYISCEGLSVFSNLALLGVPFPMVITHILEIMREDGDKGIYKK